VKIIKRLLIAFSVATLAIFGSSLPANAYGTGTWTVQPNGCNSGSFSGTSNWYYTNVAEAMTSESGNFCWAGNHQVSAQVIGAYSNQGSGTAFGANYVSMTYPTTYNSGWGGLHGWGSAGTRT